MKKTFSKLFLAPLTILVLASFAMAPVVEARGDGGGRGGGGARGGGGGGGSAKQVNHANRDVRANNVRSTSVNNVSNRNTNINANRNVNVNVDNHRGSGWDNDYHPVATAAAVTATVAVTAAVVGSMVRTVPAGCVQVNYGGMIYRQCGSTWYQPQGTQYIVINPPY